MEDASQIADGAGHSGGHDALDDGEVMRREGAPAVDELALGAMPAWARRCHLDQAATLEAGDAEERGGGAVGSGRRRPSGEREPDQPLFPGGRAAGDPVHAPADCDPSPVVDPASDLSLADPAGQCLLESENAVLSFG
jgi:hypothetical protein